MTSAQLDDVRRKLQRIRTDVTYALDAALFVWLRNHAEALLDAAERAESHGLNCGVREDVHARAVRRADAAERRVAELEDTIRVLDSDCEDATCHSCVKCVTTAERARDEAVRRAERAEAKLAIAIAYLEEDEQHEATFSRARRTLDRIAQVKP